MPTAEEMAELERSGRSPGSIKAVFGRKLNEMKRKIRNKLILVQDDNGPAGNTRSRLPPDNVEFDPGKHEVIGEFGDWGYFRDIKFGDEYRTNYLTGVTEKVGGGFAVNGVQYEPLYRAGGKWIVPLHMKYKRNKILFGGKEPHISPKEMELFEKYRKTPELFRKIYANNRDKLVKFYHYIH